MHEIIDVNGATLLFSPFKDLETASLGVFLRIGSRYETTPLRGIAHYLEHLLFKGSRKYSYKEIKREIEGRGGSLNGFTSQEFTGYYAHFLKKNLRPTLDILLDMVFEPLLKSEDVEKERNVILEEIKMYNDLPSSRVGMLLDKLLWRNHPLGEEIVGTFETVRNIKRKDLAHFKEHFYLAPHTIISCAGSFDKETIIDLLRQRIKKTPLRNRLLTQAPERLRGLHIKAEKKKLEQTHLCLGFRGVSYFSREKFSAELINIILGANMSSRLFEEVREKRALCYEISTDARKYKDSGAFIIHTGLDKSKLEVALSCILKELATIKEKDVGEKELARAKDYLLGQVAMSLERPQGKMFYLAESYLTLGKIYTLNEIKKEIEAVSVRQIKKLSQKLFTFENMCVSCVGELIDGVEGKIKHIVTKFRS